MAARRILLHLQWVLCGLAAVATGTLSSADEADQDPGAFFESEVQPVLEANCFKCHGARERIKGGLRLTSRAGLLEGGDTGPAVDTGDPDASLLLAMISYSDEDHEMPPAGKLDTAEIEILTRWVQMGAPGSMADSDDTPEEEEGPVIEPWAYGPLTRPEVPKVANRAWPSSPIDAFVARKLEERGLTPAPRAERVSLFRRATYDLTGLPPTPAEVDAFLADDSAEAYEAALERLLASPHYGEKWGRHWLDLVRYAETNGFERDSDKPFIWRYRDYVIDSFNADKPYDRFIIEQLAGDELDEVTPETLTATGFYRLMQWDDEPGQGVLQARYDTLDDIVSTTSQVFLGMTMGCARCHDHKKDPIPQKDYYRFMSFFHGVTDMSVSGHLVDVMTEEERSDYEAQVTAKREREAELSAQIAALERTFVEESGREPKLAGLTWHRYSGEWESLPDFGTLQPVAGGVLPGGKLASDVTGSSQPFGLVYEGELAVPEDGDYVFALTSTGGARLAIDGEVVVPPGNPFATGARSLRAGNAKVRIEFHVSAQPLDLTASWSSKLTSAQVASRSALTKKLEESKRERVPEKRAPAVQEKGPDVADLFVQIRGNAASPGDKVEPAFPSALDPPPVAIPPRAEGARTSGRRRALAEWIASADNPMTARVMANRLWQFHFGRGLVRTSSDFGGLGERPTHPELLDWLAAELVERGWSLKAMHRLIMTSSAYRMSSAADDLALESDPANELFWRFDLRRLSAEELRDSILALTGRLNPKRGGPSFFSRMPKEALATSSRPEQVWGKSPEEETFRRSVYIKVKRSLVTPLLASFDTADTDASCAVRFVTIQPTQALTLLDGDFTHEMATRFADRLHTEAGERLADQVHLALRLALGREPRAGEVADNVQFVEELRNEFDASAEDALADFCLMTLNLNEFVYLD